MNRKINTICFIFMLLFFVGAVSAANSDNETILTTQQPDPNQDSCKLSVENTEENLGACETAAVKEKVSLNAPNLKMYYKDGSKFTAKLKDKNKNPITKAKISFTVNGKTYEKETDKNGMASLDINLLSKNYTILTNFDGNGKYYGKSVKSTIEVKSTIKCSDLTKYYTNSADYSATFYNQKGNVLKNTNINFKVNGKTYSVKTNSKGLAKLPIRLLPGKYTMYSINPLTTERVSKSVNVKSLIETNDLTLTEKVWGKFNVKVLDANGKASANKTVLITINKKTYSKVSNKNGIATLNIELKAGNYTVTTKYNGLTNKNKLTINRYVKQSEFVHTTLIPSYVNVTANYVYKSAYSLKTGANGIIKMPKVELLTIEIGKNIYRFSTAKLEGIDSKTIVSGYYLVPFDNTTIKSDSDKRKLKGDGIIISKTSEYIQIDYQSKTKCNTTVFGFYASKGSGSSETLTYMENDKITAKINFQTQSYEEIGLRYSISKFYGKSVYDFNQKSYDEMTNHEAEYIKFTNTGESVTFSYFGNYIVGHPSKECIITKFAINGIEELEKTENISYGLSKKYRNSMGFEALQAYTIINEKITGDILKNWVSKSSNYLNRFGVMNVYGMHLASLETAWLADAFADKYSKEFDVNWKRDKTLTILGGINLEDTYLHILNADMGMKVTGSEKNAVLFRLINSINLPILEDYSLLNVANRFKDNTVNSLDNVLSAIQNNEFSFVQLGKMIYVFSENDAKSAIILNTTSGIANVILNHGNTTYKGSLISTSKDCCSVGMTPKDIIKGIESTLDLFSIGADSLSAVLDNLHPFSIITYLGVKLILGKTLQGASSACLGLFSFMTVMQTGGTIYRDKIADESEWYKTMDAITFTRPGYLQGKKIYNIPNGKGGYDYVEVKINDDLTLDRDTALYISDGKTKQLTKAETYKYFSEDYWTPLSVPAKYWDESWNR